LELLECITEEQKASFAPICPDFVIELRSASDSLNQDKCENYMDNGASLGWLIDRKNRKFYIYRHDQAFEIFG